MWSILWHEFSTIFNITFIKSYSLFLTFGEILTITSGSWRYFASGCKISIKFHLMRFVRISGDKNLFFSLHFNFRRNLIFNIPISNSWNSIGIWNEAIKLSFCHLIFWQSSLNGILSIFCIQKQNKARNRSVIKELLIYNYIQKEKFMYFLCHILYNYIYIIYIIT